MGRLSSEEFHTLARREAAREFGSAHKGWYNTLQFAPQIAGLVGLGLLGLGGWWLYSHAHAALARSGTDTAPAAVAHAGVPIWLWLIGAVLVIATAVTYRPGRIPSTVGITIAKAGLLVALWLAWIGLLLSHL
jgi:hypothetical protein